MKKFSNISLRFFVFCAYLSKDLCWFRFGKSGAGFKIARTEMLFSERYGYRKCIKLPFGWRFSILPKYPMFYKNSSPHKMSFRKMTISFNTLENDVDKSFKEFGIELESILKERRESENA